MAPTNRKNNDKRQEDAFENIDDRQGGRVKWSKELTHILCDMCLQFIEKSKGKRGDITSQKLVWARIVPEFQKHSKLSWDKSKLKNKLDSLKQSWNRWKQLKGKETGLGWDSNKGTIDASEEWWASKIKENPKFDAFQAEGIDPDLESKLDSIFLCSAQGVDKYTPIANSPQRLQVDDAYIPSPPQTYPHLSLNENESIGGNSAWDDLWGGGQNEVDENIDATPTSTPLFPQDSQTEMDGRKRGKRALESDSFQSNKSARTSSSTRRGGAVAMVERIDGMMEVIVENQKESKMVRSTMMDLMKTMTISAPKHSVTDGFAKLCSLTDLESGSPLFYFACTMIEDPQKRSIFFDMPDDQKLGYIKFLYQENEERKRH